MGRRWHDMATTLIKHNQQKAERNH